MAIFTPLDFKQAWSICKEFDLDILDFSPIQAGVTNSNFLLSAKKNKKYILTIVEQIDIQQLQQIVNMLEGLPSEIPRPKLQNYQNVTIREFNNKPVIITEFMMGDYPEAPNRAQIAEVATVMSKLHSIESNFTRPNPRGLNWMQQAAGKILEKIPLIEQDLLVQTMESVNHIELDSLPKGIIHNDLFRDNTLFLGDELNAVIDFYYACYDTVMIDLAVSINDWCFDQPDLFLEPYQKIRALSDKELSTLPLMRQFACLNFWLSRLLDVHFPRPGETPIKDPDEMRDKLVMLRG